VRVIPSAAICSLPSFAPSRFVACSTSAPPPAGKRYQISEGDGLFYSYSVYDSYDQLARWADRIFLLPTDPLLSQSWFHPLLTSPGIVLIAIRDPRSPADKN
jgi:hypothetical protein